MMTTFTAEQAKIIRTADSICFDHATEQGQPVGYLRAIFCETDTRTEVTHTYKVESSRVEDYSGKTGDATGFSMIGSAQYSDGWRTIARHIKAGSVMAFLWTRDNSSPVTREAGLVVDMLDVKVQNTVRGKLVVDTFRVATYIGLDNCTRMVKRS